MSESYEAFLLEQGGENACLRFFFQCRWPSGYLCPQCGCREAYTIATRRMPLFECARCHYQASVTSGTILEGTRTPLSKWLFALHRMSDPSSGINAVQLAQLIRVTYKTAYAMLDKIRQSLLSSETELLSGSIEAGLAIWGREKLSSLQLGDNEQPVAAGVACDSAGQPVRIALMEVSRSEMLDRTMTPMGCHLFKSRFFSSDSMSQKNAVYRSKYLTNRHCKTLASICKAGFKRIHDTYHGVTLRNLGKYLSEFAFRWNALQNGGHCLRRMTMACSRYSPASSRLTALLAA